MSISRDTLEAALKDMGLTIETDGKMYLHTTRGRFAPLVNAILNIDEDEAGLTLMVALGDLRVPDEKRGTVCELLNLVHGQSLWNVRFHLDDAGRVFSIGKVQTWGKPFNPTQFGDIFFSLLVTTDRIYPCLVGAIEDGLGAPEAFERFFLSKAAAAATDETPDEGGSA